MANLDQLNFAQDSFAFGSFLVTVYLCRPGSGVQSGSRLWYPAYFYTVQQDKKLSFQKHIERFFEVERRKAPHALLQVRVSPGRGTSHSLGLTGSLKSANVALTEVPQSNKDVGVIKVEFISSITGEWIWSGDETVHCWARRRLNGSLMEFKEASWTESRSPFHHTAPPSYCECVKPRPG